MLSKCTITIISASFFLLRASISQDFSPWRLVNIHFPLKCSFLAFFLFILPCFFLLLFPFCISFVISFIPHAFPPANWAFLRFPSNASFSFVGCFLSIMYQRPQSLRSFHTSLEQGRGETIRPDSGNARFHFSCFIETHE